MALLDGVVILVVSWIVGAIGIYAGVELVTDREVSGVNAAVTALLGALVYAVLGFLSIVPVLGPLLLLVLWVGVINWRYPGGWGTAAGIGLVAWAVAFVVLYALTLVTDGLLAVEALGIPGA